MLKMAQISVLLTHQSHQTGAHPWGRAVVQNLHHDRRGIFKSNVSSPDVMRFWE